jgi:oligoendopeptidase F
MPLTDDALPVWDMTGLLIATDPDGLVQADRTISTAIDGLTALFDDHQVGLPASVAPDLTVIEGIVEAVNATFLQVQEVDEIVDCLSAADTKDAAVQRAAGRLRVQRGRLDDLEARFNRWVASLDLDDLARRSALIAAHAYPLRQRQRLARYQMSPDAEAVAAALASVSGQAWASLRDDLEASVTGQVEIDGVKREVSAGEFQTLLSSPDRDLRRRAHEAQLVATEPIARPLAAAVNAVKGETLLLTARRGWSDPLEPMLVANGVDLVLLETLLGAVRAARPIYHRYLRTLAQALGLPRLAAYDLSAPVGSARSWTFADAGNFVKGELNRASPALGAVAERAIRDHWIDAGPRPGKVDGAFCTGVGQGQSRILLNFAPSYLGMSTLAHELGHAYHVAVLHQQQRTWLQTASVPMTLAETASTFCEVLVQHAARLHTSPEEEVGILGGWLEAATDTVFGVLKLYDLEQALFAARRDHELSVAELNELAIRIRDESFGEAVEPIETSYLWGIWHLGQPDIWHYTFPYIFGMLFGMGLYARYQRDPATFFPRLDSLLADVNLADASTLAGRFDIDLRDAAFWQESLAVLEADIARFETLVAATPREALQVGSVELGEDASLRA